MRYSAVPWVRALVLLEVPVDIGEERPAIVIEPVEDPIRRPAEKPVPSEPDKVEIPA
jgi:hypothetical protein